MAENYFDQISNQIKTGNEPFKWYRNRIKELGTPSVPELLRSGKLNDRPAGRALNMFVYSPKLRNKLPYFDTFPLVLPLKSMGWWFPWSELSLPTICIESKTT